MANLSHLAACRNSAEIIASSTGYCSSDWREWWRAESIWKKEAATEYHKSRAGRRLIVEADPEHLKWLRRLMHDNVSLERAWDEISRAARERYNEAPKVTYDAVVYELRTYGLPRLKNQNCQRRLADLSRVQLKNLIASLQHWRSQYPKVTDELLTALGEIYSARERQ